MRYERRVRMGSSPLRAFSIEFLYCVSIAPAINQVDSAA